MAGIPERNKKTFTYALYVTSEPILDKYGHVTGQKKPIYGEPVVAKASISPSKGASSIEMFGTDIEYNRTIITDDMNCPIDEHSIIWLKNNPNTQPHDYIVTAVAEGLESISYAIKKVDVS